MSKRGERSTRDDDLLRDDALPRKHSSIVAGSTWMRWSLRERGTMREVDVKDTCVLDGQRKANDVTKDDHNDDDDPGRGWGERKDGLEMG